MKKKRNRNMFNRIFKREIGLHSPRKLAELKKTERICSLQLSSQKTFEEVHTGGINSLSLSPDLFGRRYLLSAASKGTIAIHDLSARDGNMCKLIEKVDKDSEFMHQLNVETVSWYPHDSGIFLSRYYVGAPTTLHQAIAHSIFGWVFRVRVTCVQCSNLHC
jgi:WD40 repeat protein